MRKRKNETQPGVSAHAADIDTDTYMIDSNNVAEKERLLNEFVKIHPMCSAGGNSSEIMRHLQGAPYSHGMHPSYN